MKSKQKHNAVIVAHPDDETLFFAGLILQKRQRPWSLICVTDGNGDGNGRLRMGQFAKAAKALGAARSHAFALPDTYARRLNITRIQEHLGALEEFHHVYTHNPVGEYGHPHHQDVSFAVHSYYDHKCPVRGVAYNCAPDEKINLTTQNLKIKQRILSRIYYSETCRLIHLLPAHYSEGFATFALNEVQTIHRYFASGGPLMVSHLRKFKWYGPYLHEQRKRMAKRPF
jgi:hypothetical protein